MRLRSFVCLAVMALFGLTQPVFAADVAKIGIVDFQKVFETSTAGKAAKDEINTQGKKLEADLKAKGSELEETKKRLEREALVMSREKREEKEREFRIQVNDFKSLQKKYERDLQRTQKRLLGEMRKDVLEIIAEVGKSEGYLMIIEKIGVLYAPSALDISDLIIQKYNEKMAKSGKSE
ncbi:MAG: OmpH family outer membrane protein [Desulfosarcinaceae bacterium]|nr:OmpH family outer membrane protein [Desulfosarcinaceae bacterium]